MADINVTATSDVGQLAGLLAAIVKAVDDGVNLANSPQLIAARENVDVQRAYDQLKKDADAALQTGDMSKVEKELS